jgi:AcrR family transcriptional regulator
MTTVSVSGESDRQLAGPDREQGGAGLGVGAADREQGGAGLGVGAADREQGGAGLEVGAADPKHGGADLGAGAAGPERGRADAERGVADPERKAPGRPRNARADEAILDAVLALLGAGQSADAVSIEAVAAKAGVGKATIYRRWPNKDALLIDAMASMKGPLPEPVGESVREDLIMLVAGMRTKRLERYSKVTACLMPEVARSPAMHRVYQGVLEPRREVMRQVLRRGIATGELRPDLDVELTTLMLAGPVVAQNMLKWNPHVADEGFAEALVDAILRGASA